MRAGKTSRRDAGVDRRLGPPRAPSEPPWRWEEAVSSPFFDLSPDLLCAFGMDGSFRCLNPAWEEVLGWSREELLARPLFDLVHPADRQLSGAKLKKLARSFRTVTFENRCQGKDGRYRWLQWNARRGSETRLVYASARDVTDQRRLENEILETTDREQERVGRDLHDGLCQYLAGLAALSARLARQLSNDTHRAAGEAAEISQLLNDSVGHARDLARGLDPAGVAQVGLAAALETLAGNVRSRYCVHCALRCDHAWPRIDPAVETHLFRIAQEAVHNAVRHGRANRVEIALRRLRQVGLLRVRDDGSGAPSPAPSGTGLRNMDRRARLIGGRLRAAGAARSGWTVICKFPLTSDPSEDRPALKRPDAPERQP